MDYCKGCKTQECRHKEINEFFQCISSLFEKNFKIFECPDKAKLEFTCDMVLADAETKEKIYVEIKEVMYGFGNAENRNIAEEKGQINYAKLISEVIEESDIDKETELNDFIITIPRTQIGIKDINLFCGKLKDFINDTVFDDDDEYTFIFKRNGDDVKIQFNRKTEEVIQKFGYEIIFAYTAGEDNTIDANFNKMTDIDVLKKKIIYNLENTSQKKFPEEAKRKILLNILKLPVGADLFFNMNIKYIIHELMSESYDSISDANESYLLYYCDDYDDVTKTNDRISREEKGEVLFIIPLIGKWIQEPTLFQLSL